MLQALLVVVIIGGTALVWALLGVHAAAAWAWGWALVSFSLFLWDRWRDTFPGQRWTLLRGRRAQARLLLGLIDAGQAMADLAGIEVYVCRLANLVAMHSLIISLDPLETEHRKVICICRPRGIGTHPLLSDRAARAQNFRHLLEIMARAQALADEYHKPHWVVQYTPSPDSHYPSLHFLIGNIEHDYEPFCKVICKVIPR